jgi:signal transduction histidine kinase
MKQRVKELGGDLQLRHGDPGTIIEVTIPIPAAARIQTAPAVA